jgi:fibronectin type 3 domain-containing protein
VADASATEIDVTWTAVPDATSYKIERSPDGNAWTALTPNPALTASSIKYADTTATAGGTYYYRVSAIDASGTSVPSTVVHTQSVPAAPTLTPTVSSATQINLVWTTAANATSYTLQKSIDGGFTWTGAVTQAGTSYSDTTLTADTAYKYRVVANDSSGASAFSTVASGTTLENPPAGLAATVQSATAITLTWTAISDATSYKLERSTNAGTSWSTVTPGTAFTGSSASYTDTGVTAGSTDYYRISAISASGTSVPSGTVHLTTPPATTTLTATDVSASVINLAWTASSAASSYLIQVSSDGGTTWTQEALPASPAVTYVASGLSSDTLYKFKVFAVNAGGNSAVSNTASASTILAPPGSYTSGFTATPSSATQVNLAWTAVTDATSYTIQRSADNVAWATVTPGTALTGASTSYNDTGLTAGTTYYYRISAVDAAGPSVPSPVDPALTYPAAPVVTAIAASTTQINVSWPAVTGASSYIVASAPDGSTWTPLATQAGTTYQNTALTADTAYYYQVTAVNASGDSVVSNVASPSTLLAAPTGFSLSVASANEIDLTWSAVTDATNYTILRSPNGTTWTTLTANPALTSSSTGYADTTVLAGTTYYYTVEAVDAAGTSAGATTQNALTVPAAPTLSATDSSATVVNISWTAVKSATNYILQSAPDGSTWTSVVTQAGTTYSNTALTGDTKYYYQVIPVNATGNGAASNGPNVTTLLAAPTGLAATAASASEIDLTWTAETDAASYIIQRSTNQTIWKTLTPNPALTSSSTSYADTTVQAGTTYYYTIEGVDAVGASAPETSVNAMSYTGAPKLTASVASATVVNFSWNAVKGATNYVLQSSPDGSTWTSVVTQAGTTYANTGLTADTAYYYQVLGVDTSGNGTASATVPVTTFLAAPSGFTATVASPTEIDLAWTSETDATNYVIQRSLNQTVWTTLSPSPALSSASTSYADTSVSAGTTYYYRLFSVDAAGTSAAATATATLTFPAAPTLTATVASATSVNLAWNPVTGATSYIVASSPDGSTWTPISTQAGTSYTNTALTADTAYYYEVTPLDATGGGPASNSVPVTTLLAAPSGFTASVASATEIDLTWTTETDATNYTIQRSLNQTVWTTLAPSPALTSASTGYADTSVLPGTTYYYRLFSVDAAGTSAPATLTTATVPGTPTLNAAVASATAVNLSWTAAKGATSYLVQSSPDGSTWTTIATQAGTTYANTGLTADTAYYYQVIGVDAAGDGAPSNAPTLTTLLAAPSGFAASVASANEIDLTWSAETDATTYTIRRSTNQTVWTTLAPNPALSSSSTSFADTTVAAGTTYYYMLSGVDAAGTSATASTSALTVPASPALAATVSSATQANLVWTPSLGATSYLVQSSPDGSTWTTIATQAGTTYSNTALTADTLYDYQVIPVNATGDGAPSSTVPATTLLAAPSAFAVTAASSTENDLTWTAETDATNYEIDRSTNNTSWTPLVLNPALTGTSSSYADTTAVAGTNYYYRIESIDAAGTSAPATVAPILTLPATPTLTGTPVLSTEIVLSWTPAASATSYLLESSPDGSTWTPLATQAGTTYANTALTADTAYSYRVTANNATGSGATSSALPVTTMLAAPTGFAGTPASDTQINLTWTAVTDATSYQIEVSTNQTSWLPLAPSPALTGSSATYNDTTPQPGVTYYYRIESINALGISVPSTAITVTAPLPAPTGLTATAIGASQINLTWTADTATGLTGFVLQTSADNISWSNDITIGTGSTSISDVRLSASTEYYYRLLAVNAGGDSAPSNVVNATTTAS